MESIPAQIEALALSGDLYIQSEKIGDKFGLHIDQVGEMDAEIRDVLHGSSKSSDFIPHIMERLEIDRGLANQIAEEVNKEVFSSIREHLQKMESGVVENPTSSVDTQAEENKTRQEINALERIGGFSIDHEKVLAGSGAPANLPLVDEAKLETKNKILEGIENPKPSRTNLVTPNSEDHTDPLIDHLLSSPVSIPQQKTVQKPPAPPPPTPKKASGPDPYRESPK